MMYHNPKEITEETIQQALLERVHMTLEHCEINSMAQLEERAGLPAGTIAGWEHTAATLSDVVKIAEATGMTTDYLLACNRSIDSLGCLHEEMYAAKLKYDFFRAIHAVYSKEVNGVTVDEKNQKLKKSAGLIDCVVNDNGTFSSIAAVHTIADHEDVSAAYLLGMTDDPNKYG